MAVRHAAAMMLAGSLLFSATAAPAPTAVLRFAESEASQPTTLDEAVAEVARRTGGRVLSAETVVTEAGQRVFRIRVLVEPGQVRVFQVDPETGAVD